LPEEAASEGPVREKSQVPIKQLVMPNHFSALADVKQAVLRDLSEVSAL